MTRKLSLRSAALFSAVCMLLTGAVAGCKSNKQKDTDSDSSGIISSDFSSDASAGNEPTVSDNQSSQSSGGQNTASGTGSTDKTVKGTVTVLVAADAEKETAAMIDIFKKKYPNVTVKITVDGATNMVGQDLSKLSAAKKLPDVVIFGTENFSYILNQGLAYPLDKFYNADPDNKYAFQAGIENYTYAEHLFALPFRLQFNTIGVNKDLFKTLNLTDPGYNWTIHDQRIFRNQLYR